MRLKETLLLCFLGLLIFACKSETTSSKSNVKETKSKYHDIIHNSDTADSANADTLNVPKIKFDEDVFEFGKVKQGEVAKHAFSFTNVGKTNLLILDTKSSCGCTVTDYNKAPIPPGKSGVINVEFDTKDKKDFQEKKVTIFTNTNPNEFELTMSGFVDTKK